MIDTRAGPGAEAEADALSPAGLLALARSRKAAEDQAAADLLEIAAQWADLHPPESIHSAAAFTVRGSEHEEPIAGDGCPLVAEFCIAELGTTLGLSTVAAKKLIGHALELRHRLPRLWAQVQSGRVPAWRARTVAETTIHSTPALTRDAAAFVDAQVAAVAGRIGTAQLDRLVAETIKRFDLAPPDPTKDPEDGYLSVDPRHVTVHDEDVHFAGTVRVEAEIGLADAIDLDRALAHGAATQKALGSTEPLDARRATALGDLARTQTALDLFSQGGGFEARSARTSTTDDASARTSTTDDDAARTSTTDDESARTSTTDDDAARTSTTDDDAARTSTTDDESARTSTTDDASARTSTTDDASARTSTTDADAARTSTTEDASDRTSTTAQGDGLPAAREVVLHAHFDATTAADGTTVFGPTGRLEERQRLLLLEQLRSWCASSRTKITIRPVIDLNTDLSTPAYEVPDRIREQIVLRDRTCVFPWCGRNARACDVDHVIEFDHAAEAEGRPQPGPTATSNLAALCRSHHRLKTHSAWRYEMTAPGVFEWTSPHGQHYRRDRHGTTALDPPDIPRQRRP